MANSSSSSSRRLVTLAVSAEYLACSERTVRRMISEGTITAYRVGRRLIRVEMSDVEACVRVIPTVGTIR